VRSLTYSLRGLLCWLFGHDIGWRWSKKNGYAMCCRYCGKRAGSLRDE
jgi:hypothetical protein